MSNSNKKEITICLAGNPNSGKTTLFNSITGARQKVGNYPGVTVEKKEGTCKHNDVKINVIDLPGTYSLTAYSMEEIVARDFIINEKPDLVVDVVDASNIERSLYLATQLKELNIPMIVALNMSDVVDKLGHKHNEKMMSELFGAKFVKTIGHKKKGVEDLLDAVVNVASGKEKLSETKVYFDKEVENEIAKVSQIIDGIDTIASSYSSRWVAVKLLEKDQNIVDKCKSLKDDKIDLLFKQVDKSIDHVSKVCGEDSDVIITEGRYGFINGVLKESVILSQTEKISISDRIDKVLLNRVLGLPIFALIMYLIFYLSVDQAGSLIDLVDGWFGSLGETVKNVMPEGSLRSLIVDGIIGGVGGVMVFVPQILILFICIAILEATGYMSRAAFVVDRLMNKIGLHGKSFIPMLIGFGCTVPALMATRTLENKKDRLTTMLASTFMSCGARFPVYVLLTGALFSKRHSSLVIYSIYILGIVVAILTAKIMKKYVYKGEKVPFVMELPPYRIPTIRGVLHQMWEKGWMYIKKAGTIILAAAIVFWFLTSYPKLNSNQEAPYNQRVEQVNTQFDASLASLVQELNSVNGAQGPQDTSAQVSNKKLLFANAAFKEMLEKVNKVNADFKSTIEDGEIEEDSDVYKAELKKKNKKLLLISQANENLYKIVKKYISLLEVKKENAAQIENQKVAFEKRMSYAGRIGNFISPVFAPMGLNDWKVGLSLIAGLTAKEVVVGTMGAVYAIGEEEDEESVSLRNKILNDRFFLSRKPISSAKVVKIGSKYYLRSDKSTPIAQIEGKFYKPNTLVAFVFMVFVLLYLPCLAVLGVYIKEAGLKNALIMMVYTTGVAYLISTIIYWGGRLIGLG